jgi:hypothetical protein
MDPILSQLNPVRPIDPYFLKVNLNVILPPTPGLTRGFTFIAEQIFRKLGYVHYIGYAMDMK